MSISLLDCNHKTSSQYLSGNRNTPALFTNKLGSGIKVNPGDKVSVHNAFIAETGSDDNAIQITSEFLETKSLTYTTLTGHNVVNGSGNYVLGYERITAANEASNVEVRANKTSILLNYYKTNNGENHFNLPRRFCYLSENHSVTNWRDVTDSTNFGMLNGSNVIVTPSNASFNNNNTTNYIVDDDYFYYGVIVNPGSNTKGFRPKNNNARFKIMVAKDTRYGTQTSTLDPLINASFTTPAILDYIEYIDKVDIEIPVGFKSPEALANLITNQLQKQTQPKINSINSGAIYNANASLVTDRPVNVQITSPTYKTFYAGSSLTQNKPLFDDYETAVTANTENASTNRYLSSYQFIGVKRPELWLRGREWAKYYMDYRNTVLPPGNQIKNITSAVLFNKYELNASQFWQGISPIGAVRRHQIVFDQEWDFNILLSLSKIFKEQGNHPELFENKYTQLNGFTTVNNSRFIHMNALAKKNRPATIQEMLGSDYQFQNASNLPNLLSIPLFFDFNPEYEDIYTEGVSWGDGYAFGVFKKYNDGLNDYISVTTEHLGIIGAAGLDAKFTTIPNNVWSLHENNDETNFKIGISELVAGWDCHFTSYGNVCIGLLDGWTSESFEITGKDADRILNIQATPFNQTEINGALYSQQIYLGADNPSITYNNISNRFEISELHTSERVQNRYNAGGVDKDSKHDEFVVNEFATSGDKVYKINKRLYNTNFTPNIMPYGANRDADITVAGNAYQVDFLNPNLSPWTIYDQLTGIIITDFGYSKNNFEAGLWGTLGFTYEQFNASRTSANDLTTRIGNDNKDNLPYALTNADVGQQKTMDFITNVWGAGTYSLQLPSTMAFNKINTTNLYFRDNQNVQVYPAITENATSVKLVAPNLPRKLANPYFCIRSDILDSSEYIGGADCGELYPVIAIVPKSNDYGDFFVNTSPDLEFEFTKAKTITSITTSIHNPTQELANVDDASAVIYKITRQLPNNRFNIVQQILQDNKNKK